MGSIPGEALEEEAPEPSLIMFSGGRDSTLAVVRLHLAGTPMTMVTVTSDHLVGIRTGPSALDRVSALPSR